MKKSIRIFSVLMALVLVIGAFTACGAKETKTVEQIIAENEEVKTQIESLGEADDMEASISGNTTFDEMSCLLSPILSSS